MDESVLTYQFIHKLDNFILSIEFAIIRTKKYVNKWFRRKIILLCRMFITCINFIVDTPTWQWRLFVSALFYNIAKVELFFIGEQESATVSCCHLAKPLLLPLFEINILPVALFRKPFWCCTIFADGGAGAIRIGFVRCCMVVALVVRPLPVFAGVANTGAVTALTIAQRFDAFAIVDCGVVDRIHVVVVVLARACWAVLRSNSAIASWMARSNLEFNLRPLQVNKKGKENIIHKLASKGKQMSVQ